MKRGQSWFVGCLVASLVLAACSSSSKSASTGSSTTSAGSTGTQASASGAPNVPLNAPLPAGGNGGSTDTGVTATSIKTFILTEGSAGQPGQNTGAYQGASAYFAYVNAQGGVYGRQITMQNFNDQYVPTQAQAICQAQIPNTFAQVSSPSAATSGCYDLVKSSGIPWVSSISLDPRFFALPNAPTATDPTKFADGFQKYMHSLKPSATKIAILGLDVPGVQGLLDQESAVDTAAGFTTVLKQLIPEGAPNLAQYVTQIRGKGAQAVDAIGVDQTTAGRLAAAFGQQGFEPDIKFGSNSYNSVWHQLVNGDAAAGWYQTINYAAFQDPAAINASEGGKLFNYWLNKAFPGFKSDVYTMNGWFAANEFVQGLIAAGPDLTRASYLKAANAITSFNSNGLFGTVNPSAKEQGVCFAAVMTTATGYQQTHPTAPGTFDCTSGQLVPVPAS